jgi:hypothetical protein
VDILDVFTADPTAMAQALELEKGVDVQPYNAGLASRLLAYPTGRWLAPDIGPWRAAAGANGQNNMRGFLGFIRRAVTIDDLGVRVSTAAAGGNCQLAIYAMDETTLAPTGAPLYNSGNLSTASTGALAVGGGIAEALVPGFYWWFINCDASANTAQFTTIDGSQSSASPIFGATSIGNAGSINGQLKAQTYGTWPTLTGSFSGDSFSDIITAVQAMIYFKV